MINKRGIFYGVGIGFLLLFGMHVIDTDLMQTTMDCSVKSPIIISGGIFHVPSKCKKLGILGSTPHPTQYIIDNNNNMSDFSVTQLRLEEFLDIQALEKTFGKVLGLCKNENIDVLLIAYLPVYFSSLKSCFGGQCTIVAHRFFYNIAPQIQNFIYRVQRELGISTQIYIHLPTIKQCQQIPDNITYLQQYTQFLVKHFPKIEYQETALEAITVINTKVEDQSQSADIIKYFQYKNLLLRPICFEIAELEQKKFHIYRSCITKEDI